MKKFFALAAAAVMLISLVACGGNETVSSNIPQDTPEVPVVNPTVAVPYSSEDCEGKEQASLVSDFNTAGFINITEQKVEDLASSEADTVGSVISVSIGGQTEFTQGQEFDRNDEVVVSYHVFKKCTITMHIDFIPNLIFSKYNVNLNMNDVPQGTLEHGEDKDFEFLVDPGEYTFTFEEDGASDVNGSTIFDIKGDTDISLKISCYSDRVDIETLFVEDLEAAREEAAVEAALESALPKEMARRAVVVAMTNCQATDVFTDDGNSYDPSKFHSYNDIEDFFMTVETDGIWTVSDENTWHVEDILLRIFDYDTYLKATCNIKKDGDHYIVFNVERAIAAKDYIDSDDPSKINIEHFEPSENSPFLTVPSALISEDRDTAAAQDKITAKEDRQLWIENQFHWWDGRHTELSELIKDNLNDSDSFEHVDASFIDVYDEERQAIVNQTLKDAGFSESVAVGDLFIIQEFTAKNAFNATIKSTAYGIVRGSDNGVILLGII